MPEQGQVVDLVRLSASLEELIGRQAPSPKAFQVWRLKQMHSSMTRTKEKDQL